MSDDHDGDGSNEIRADEYLSIKQELVAATLEKDRAVAKIRTLIKRFKDAGADTDAIADLRKLAKLSPEERTAREKAKRKYAAWEGIILWAPGMPDDAEQDEMFDEPSPEMQQSYKDALIHSDGYNSRMAKGDRGDNPQVAGSSAYQMWDRGWLDCDGDLTARAEPEKAASTERKPRVKKGAAAALNDEIAGELSSAGATVN